MTASSVHTYYVGHMLAASGLAVGQKITAGQRLGTTSPVSHALDLGVLNSTVTNAFVNPDRYGTNSRQAEAPYKFFGDTMKSQLGALIQTTADNREGQLNFDRSGTLSGNWFADDLPPERSSIGGDMSVGTRQLSFARDVFAPDRRRVSLGGLGMTGLWGVPPDAPMKPIVLPAAGQEVKESI